jgi:hypothetical protein
MANESERQKRTSMRRHILSPNHRRRHCRAPPDAGARALLCKVRSQLASSASENNESLEKVTPRPSRFIADSSANGFMSVSQTNEEVIKGVENPPNRLPAV